MSKLCNLSASSKAVEKNKVGTGVENEGIVQDNPGCSVEPSLLRKPFSKDPKHIRALAMCIPRRRALQARGQKEQGPFLQVHLFFSLPVLIRSHQH